MGHRTVERRSARAVALLAALLAALLVALAAAAPFLHAQANPRPGVELAKPRPRATRPSGREVRTVPLGRRPYGVTLTPEGTLYVGRVDAPDLTVYEAPEATPRSIPMIGPAYDVITLPDAGTVYAVNVPAHAISVIDRPTLAVLRGITGLGEPFRVRPSPEGGYVFVTTSRGALHRISSTDDSVVTVRLAGVLNGLAVNEPRRVLYATSTDGDLFEIDLDRLTLLRRIAVGGRPQGMAVSEDGGTLYLANEEVGAQVIDAATLSVRATIAGTDLAFDVALTHDGAELYVTRPSARVIEVIDVASGAIVRSHRGGRPRRMAFSTDGTVLVIANEDGWLTIIR